MVRMAACGSNSPCWNASRALRGNASMNCFARRSRRIPIWPRLSFCWAYMLRTMGVRPKRAPHRLMRILDVGCGVNKRPGAVGLDRNPASRADVLADLDRHPYPFRDSSFDALYAVHVIEHVTDVIRSMEEFHRLVRAGGE